jgi:hypothetical protein
MTDVSRSEIANMTERLNKHEREIADNRHNINGNQALVDIRLKQVATSIDELKNILKWAGGLVITLMISFMSWSALQQYNANESQKEDLKQQIELIKNTEQADKDRAAILDQLRKDLGASGTITTDPPSGGR